MSQMSAVRYWGSRLIYCLIVSFFGVGVTALLCLYVGFPATQWLTTDTPSVFPEKDLLERAWNFVVLCTCWISGVTWLSEFLPWLSKIIRNRE